MAPVAGSSKPRCRLLELPAELRNRIYAYVLYHDRENGDFGTTTILRACRQIYNEAKNMIHQVGFFNITVETILTLWWDPNSIGTTRPVERSAIMLAISGGLESFVSGKRSEYKPSGPASGPIYNIFPEAMLEVTSLNIKIEPRCHFTTQNFIYALACFLNNPGARCKEMKIAFDLPPGDNLNSHGSYNIMWYGLAKIPASIKITLDGNLYPPDWRRRWDRLPGIEVTHKYIRGDHAHPDTTQATKLSTISVYKRVAALVHPYLRRYELGQECDGVDCEHSACRTEEREWLWQRLEDILDKLRDRFEGGVIPLDDRSLLSAEADHHTMVDLELIETWGNAIVTGDPIHEWSHDAEMELYREYRTKREDYSEILKWEDGAEKEVEAETRRRLGGLERLWGRHHGESMPSAMRLLKSRT